MPDAAVSLALMWVDPATGETMKVPLDHALRLGSNRQQNDVALPFAGVEALHAEIVSRPGGWEIAPVGVLRLKVDGAMVPRAELRPGSTFSIGILDFTVGYAGKAPEGARPAGRTPATTSGSRIVVPPPPRRPAVAGPRPPEPDRRLTFALLGGGLVAVAAAGLWFAVLRPKASRPPVAASTAGAAASNPVSTGTAAAGTSAPAASAAAPPASAADPFEAAKKSVVTVIAKLAFEKGFATGTGFFVTTSGKLVTNFHVVKRTDYQQILMPGQKKPVDARILATDEEHDLALLQAMIDPPAAVAPLASGAILKMGDPVFALGSPAGPALEMSLSRGIVSSDRPRQFGDIALIQHDAAINPGNSGGPLLDQQGRVVGVNTLKIRETQGLSFAIPVDQVREFLALPR